MSYTDRIRELRISAASEELSYQLFPLKGAWPALEVIDTLLDSAKDEYSHLMICNRSFSSPLRKIDFFGSTVLNLDPIPTQHLEYITIWCDNMGMRDLVIFAKRCSVARKLTLAASTRREVTVAPFDLPFLESLDVFDSIPPSSLSIIRCTNLRNLTLSRNREWFFWRRGPVEPHWSLPYLTSLSLENLEVDSSLQPFLRAVPSICSLSLFQCKRISNVLDALLYQKDDETFKITDATELIAPGLEQLVISGCPNKAGTLGKNILALLRRRPRLHVRVDAARWEDSDTSPELLERETAGRFEYVQDDDLSFASPSPPPSPDFFVSFDDLAECLRHFCSSRI